MLFSLPLAGLGSGSITSQDTLYPGIPRPTYTNAQLDALGYQEWAVDTISMARPALPSPWTSDVTNFYYVESGGSNSNEGYPGNPRGTIPDPIPEGAVVCVHGSFNQSFSAPSNLTFSGTSSNPSWLMAYDSGNRPTLGERMEVDGAWGIIDNINFSWTGSSTQLFRNSGSFMTFRHGSWIGSADAGGTFAAGNDTIWYDLTINDARSAGSEANERHGCKNTASRQWFIDCVFNNNNGDGIQSGSNPGDTHSLVFCGGCSFDGNRQSGFWTKAGIDHIVSNCTGFNATVTTGGSGCPFGGQYGSDYYWFLFSTGHTSDTGMFRLASASGGTGTNNHVIGCLSYDCGDDTTQTDTFGDCGIGFWSEGVAVVHNTIWGNVGGFYKQTSASMNCYGNIFGPPAISDGRHIWINNTTSLTSDYNVFAETASLASSSSGTEQTLAQWRTATSQDANSIESTEANLLFTNVASKNFHIGSGSTAEIASQKHQSYTDFENRYGLDIYVDRDGNSRGSSTAAGCYEAT